MCDQEPEDCSGFSTFLCSNSAIGFYCPVVCGQCDSTTISTTTTTVATTTLFNCLSNVPDDEVCSMFPAASCENESIQLFCPRKCLC
jgi:hypothetical protein